MVPVAVSLAGEPARLRVLSYNIHNAEGVDVLESKKVGLPLGGVEIQAQKHSIGRPDPQILTGEISDDIESVLEQKPRLPWGPRRPGGNSITMILSESLQ
jgi:hypothetical protein